MRFGLTFDSTVRAPTRRAFVARRTRNLVPLLRRHFRRFDVRREGFHAAQTARRAPKQKTRLRIFAPHRLGVVAVRLGRSSRASTGARGVFRRHHPRVRARTRRVARAIDVGDALDSEAPTRQTTTGRIASDDQSRHTLARARSTRDAPRRETRDASSSESSRRRARARGRSSRGVLNTF